MTTKILYSLILAITLSACACGSKQNASQVAPTTTAVTATSDSEANTMAKGSINGMVKDTKNKPLENVVIVITDTTAKGPVREIAPVTNAKGEFSLSGLPPGNYTLRASSPGYSPKSMKVNVEGTKTSSVDFIMTK